MDKLNSARKRVLYWEIIIIMGVNSFLTFVCKVMGMERPYLTVTKEDVKRSKFDVKAACEKIEEAVKLTFPIHKYMQERNDLAKKNHFNSLLNQVNYLYSDCNCESPRDALLKLRYIVVNFCIEVEKIPLNSKDVEFLAGYKFKDAWSIYQILDEMHLYSEKMWRKVKIHPKAGLYRFGYRYLPITAAINLKPDVRDLPVYDLYNLLTKTETEATGRKVEDVIALRTAFVYTNYSRYRSNITSDTYKNISLKIATRRECFSPNMIKDCVYCGCDKPNIYATECRHFVSCSGCLKNCSNDETCYICKTPLMYNKVFLKVDNINYVTTGSKVNAVEMCNAMVPGFVPSAALKDYIDANKHDANGIINAIGYTSIVTGVPLSELHERIAEYLYVNRWYISYTDTVVYIGSSEIKTPTPIGYAISSTLQEYIKQNPDHTVEQALMYHHVPKVYKNTDECISCMEECELLIMSMCGHQVICKDCVPNTTMRCPICRSENNVPLRQK